MLSTLIWMVYNITLQAILIVYFTNNSLNTHALNLPVCCIFILRHKGTEKCSLLQKIIIKKRQIWEQIFSTPEFAGTTLESNRTDYSFPVNEPSDYLPKIKHIIDVYINKAWKYKDVFNKQYFILVNPLLQLATITINFFIYRQRDIKSQVTVLYSVPVNTQASHLWSFRGEWHPHV